MEADVGRGGPQVLLIMAMEEARTSCSSLLGRPPTHPLAAVACTGGRGFQRSGHGGSLRRRRRPDSRWVPLRSSSLMLHRCPTALASLQATACCRWRTRCLRQRCVLLCDTSPHPVLPHAAACDLAGPHQALRCGTQMWQCQALHFYVGVAAVHPGAGSGRAGGVGGVGEYFTGV